MAAPVCLSPSRAKGPLTSHSCPQWVSCSSNEFLANGHKVMFHYFICLSLIYNVWTSLHVFRSSESFLFCKTPLLYFAHFFYWSISWLSICASFLYILDISPLSDLKITDIAPFCVTLIQGTHKCFIFTLLYLVIPNFKNNYFANNKNYMFGVASSVSSVKLIPISDVLRTVWRVFGVQCMLLSSSLYLIQIYVSQKKSSHMTYLS